MITAQCTTYNALQSITQQMVGQLHGCFMELHWSKAQILENVASGLVSGKYRVNMISRRDSHLFVNIFSWTGQNIANVQAGNRPFHIRKFAK